MNDEEKDFIIDELLNLNNQEEKDQISIDDVQNRIISEMKNDNLIDKEMSNTILDPKNETFVSIIKDNVNFCVAVSYSCVLCENCDSSFAL